MGCDVMRCIVGQHCAVLCGVAWWPVTFTALLCSGASDLGTSMLMGSSFAPAFALTPSGGRTWQRYLPPSLVMFQASAFSCTFVRTGGGGR